MSTHRNRPYRAVFVPTARSHFGRARALILPQESCSSNASCPRVSRYAPSDRLAFAASMRLVLLSVTLPMA